MKPVYNLLLLTFSLAIFTISSCDGEEEFGEWEAPFFFEEQIRYEEGSAFSIDISGQAFPDDLVANVTAILTLENAGSPGNATPNEDFYILNPDGTTSDPTSISIEISADRINVQSPLLFLVNDGIEEGQEMIRYVLEPLSVETIVGQSVTIQDKFLEIIVDDNPEAPLSVSASAPEIVSIHSSGTSIQVSSYFEGNSEGLVYSLTDDQSGASATASIENDVLYFETSSSAVGQNFDIEVTASNSSGFSVAHIMEVRVVGDIVTSDIDVLMLSNEDIGSIVDIYSLVQNAISIEGDTEPVVVSASSSNTDAVEVDQNSIGQFSVNAAVVGFGQSTIFVVMSDLYGGTPETNVNVTLLIEEVGISTDETPVFNSANRGNTELLGGSSGRYGTSFQFLTSEGDVLDLIMETPTDIEGQLASGTYQYGYDNATDPSDVLSFDFADFNQSSTNRSAEVLGGSIVITRNADDDYKFEFSLELEGGGTLISIFEGEVTPPN